MSLSLMSATAHVTATMLVMLLILFMCECDSFALANPSFTSSETSLLQSHFGWPLCEQNALQSSGYIDIPGINNTVKHYFYWLFGPRQWRTTQRLASSNIANATVKENETPPLIMWMTGGPGCSSGIALAIENGPCLINESTGELVHNPFGWNDNAYLLYVDQPTGVGYSFGSRENYIHNESEVAEDMYHFLQRFIQRFKEPNISLQQTSFYIIGESYGGHYVPAVAHRILRGNENKDGVYINLQGIGIGNGLTDPYTQYPAYAELAYNWCITKLGHPCISEQGYAKMLSLLLECLKYIKECNDAVTDDNAACVLSRVVCGEYEQVYPMTGLNNYDIRKQCIGDLCYPMNHTIAFFTNDKVKEALGVPQEINWSTCNRQVSMDFVRDFLRNFNYTIPPLLQAGIRVLIYAGDTDYICNWIGNKAWVTALNWPGKEKFNAAPDVEFTVNGREAGRERSYGNFSFVQIYDAGHMVPMDQPEVALYMVHRFLDNKLLQSKQELLEKKE